MFSMSTSSSTASLNEHLPTTVMAGMSLYDASQPTPTPRDKKTASDPSLATITPPDSSRGAPVTSDTSFGPASRSAEPIFVSSHEGDDVFGHGPGEIPNCSTALNSTSSTAIAKIQSQLVTPNSFKHNPRPDRMNSPITPANAQGVLLPEACVFVANLATGRTDEQLEIDCHQHFDVFGDCHIKVRRDKHRHPFALVQYHKAEDAEEAIRSTFDTHINGRKIRCEPAQARRAVVLSKINGGAVSVEEAEQALKDFGPISQMHPTTHRDHRELGMPEGMWVEFAYYLDFKDALKSFDSMDGTFKIEVARDAETRARPGPDASPITRGLKTPRSVTDQKSIFVGNLPEETTEYDLRRIFSQYGTIKAVNIIHKPINGGSGYNIFGFIEFSTVSEADAAASMEVEVHDVKIRVEPKEYSARRHTRLQYSPAQNPPYWRHAYQHTSRPFYNDHHTIPLANYNPNFYGLVTPLHHNDMSQYHAQHHAGNGGYGHMGAYNTPPPSARMNRRNGMMYTGSPHHMAQWSPFYSANVYPGAMMQIPEEMEGQRY